MEQENAVNPTQAEQTAPVESAPTETETADTQSAEAPTPASETTEPEKKVSDMVPRSRLNEVIEERNAYRDQAESTPAPEPVYETPENSFDEDTQKALDRHYDERRKVEKAHEFVARHKEELSDPVLAGTTERLISEANAKGRTIDYEAALTQAKGLIEGKLQKPVQAAAQAAEQETREVVRNKQQAGAVGQAGTNTKPDPTKLSAKEFAAYHNLPRKDV